MLKAYPLSVQLEENYPNESECHSWVVPTNELIVKVVTNYKEINGFEIINFEFITNEGTMR